MATRGDSNGLFVYILRSLQNPEKTYVGLTANVEKRLKEHNAARFGFTAKFAPWEVVNFVWFRDPKNARAFERFLKHGSGHAFAQRHFIGVGE